MYKIVLQEDPSLPLLGWIARLSKNQGLVSVRHGLYVETGESWAVEGTWDAEFEAAGFHRSQHFFGSGIRVDDDGVHFVASTALLDRILYADSDNELVCSNSLPLLLGATGAKLDTRHNYYAEAWAIMAGRFDYKKNFHALSDTYEFGQVYGENLVFSGGKIHTRPRPFTPVPLDCFKDYVNSLNQVIDSISANLHSEKRSTAIRPMTTLSSGYDSATVAQITKRAGVTACYTTDNKADPSLEDGATIADKLALNTVLLSRIVPEHDNELYILAATPDGRETIFENMFRDMKSNKACTALFTGYHGDKLWERGTAGKYQANAVLRGDTSGLNLAEVRLTTGFFNIALPFIFAPQISDIVAISNRPEMHPWTLFNDYDRPIARRIVEEAGVPRKLFGFRKQVVMDYQIMPRNEALRTELLNYLADELGFGAISYFFYRLTENLDWLVKSRLPFPAKKVEAWRINKKLWAKDRRLENRIYVWAVNKTATGYRFLNDNR